MNKINFTEEDRKKIQILEIKILKELDRICKKYDIKYTVSYGTLIGSVRHKGFIPWDDDIDVSMMRSDYEKFEKICKKELNDNCFYQSHDTDQEYYHLFNKIRLNGTIFKESFLSKYNIHHGVYIDIFPVDNIADNCIKRKIQFYKFHFYRTGLMAKYLSLDARHGKKKLIMKIMKFLYFPFSLEKLYNGAIKTSIKYNNKQTKNVCSFCSPYHEKDIVRREIYTNYERKPFENIEVSQIENYDEILTQIYGDYMKLPPIDQRITRHDLVDLKID